jgi:hypothetical protein
MIARVAVWRCIGCGRIEGPQPCIGVCEDRKDEMVYASDHEAELERARQQLESLATVLRQIAFTTPRDGECGRTWLALQARARAALDGIRDDAPTVRK